MDSRPPRSGSKPLGLVLAGLALGGLLGAVIAGSWSAPKLPALPPASSSVTIVKATPNVLLAVRDLARLESAEFHMERVIDLTEKQSHLFGLLETEDAILLVAVADVSAGVDLSKLEAAQVRVDHQKKSATVTLPKPEIFHAALDNERTFVHTRRTGVLARRQETLETKARQEAERALVTAAKEAGIEKRAADNAKRVVEGLLRSLEFEHVSVSVAE